MLKQRGTIKITGVDKRANKTYVKKGKNIIVKELPKKGSHKKNAVFNENTGATAGVNLVAGNVNTIFQFYAPAHIENGIYARLLKVVRRANHEHRLVKLAALEGMDAHQRNRMEDLINGPEIKLEVAKNKIVVKLDTDRHAQLKREHRFYRWQVILVLWNNENNNFIHNEKRTQWIHKTDEPAGYDMEFARPAKSTDYLVMCICIRGEEKGELRLPPDRTLKIMLAGSLDPNSVKVLEDHRAALKAKVAANSHDRSVEEEGVAPRDKMKKKAEEPGVAARKPVKKPVKKTVLKKPKI